MTLTRTITAGCRLVWDGEVWDVASLDGGWATLRHLSGRSVAVSLRELAERGAPLQGSTVEPVEGTGVVLASIGEPERAGLIERLGHVREVLTGYRSGDASQCAIGEPREPYVPGTPMMDRYRAKAAELQTSEVTVRRMVVAYLAEGVIGLVDGRHHRPVNPMGRIDVRWLDAARALLEEHVGESQPPRHLFIDKVAARVTQLHGKGVVALPSESTARRALKELTAGTNSFSGSSKGKRSIASRPATPYGRLRPTRPGEYVMLDTTRLDVFAMEALTLRWVSCELTVALDLLSRTVLGLRLSPVSTKAVDAALVLYEAITPRSTAPTGEGLLPYAGVPSVVLVDPYQVSGTAEVNDMGLPGVAVETMVVDHGKIYLSEHLYAVCDRLGISIQPARVGMGPDKAAVERWFRTVREGFLAALPGYKGPDVYTRGERPETDCFFFVHELEAFLRRWVATVYHRRPHEGLIEPQVPGVELSPLEMFELGVTRAGVLRIPASPDLVYDFLPVQWRTIQHYGVEMFGLRYDGAAINAYRNRKSPYAGRSGGKWPFRYDPDDISQVFFQDPDDHVWHRLRWAEHNEIAVPFSAEALRYARHLARQTTRHPDDHQALAELLERWDVGLARNPTERRMALRLSEQRAKRLAGSTDDQSPAPSSMAILHAVPDRPSEAEDPPGGDDDDGSELDVGDFYRDAFETIR